MVQGEVGWSGFAQHYDLRAARSLQGQKKFKSSGDLQAEGNGSLSSSDLEKKVRIESGATSVESSTVNTLQVPGDGSVEPKSLSSAASAHADTVSAAFDRLASEATYRHLHQVAGWVDLSDKSVWDSYVKDVMNNKLQVGDSLFEAGCGVLAFLTSCQQLVPQRPDGTQEELIIGGLDGAKKTIEVVKRELVKPWMADNFFHGMLPDALERVPNSTWDIVVCNSVYQYLADESQAREATLEMIRIAKRWVIIADICDRKYHDITQRHRQGLENASSDLPEYATYEKSWWEREFEQLGHLVSIRHVEEPRYIRRTERYVVYIEKNAAAHLLVH